MDIRLIALLSTFTLSTMSTTSKAAAGFSSPANPFFVNEKERGFAANTCAASKIPAVINFVFLVRGGEAREIDEKTLKNVFETLQLLQRDENKIFQSHLWINKFAKPLRTVQLLEQKGVVLREIEEEAIFQADLSDLLHNLFFNALPSEFDEPDFVKNPREYLYNNAASLGVRVDLLKYFILRKEGGIVCDLNFVFQRMPNENELTRGLILFDVLPSESSFRELAKQNNVDDAMLEEILKSLREQPESFRSMENFFLAATPEHPFAKLLEHRSIENALGQPHCFRPTDRTNQTEFERDCAYRVTTRTLEGTVRMYRESKEAANMPEMLLLTQSGVSCTPKEFCFGFDTPIVLENSNTWQK